MKKSSLRLRLLKEASKAGYNTQRRLQISNFFKELYLTIRIHGDNIIECERTLALFAKAYDTQPESVSDCVYFPAYTINTSKQKIKIELFAGHDRWGININKEFAKHGAPLREAADSYVTRLIDDTNEELLFAVEYCNALPAGNNAWQRSGRAVTCAELGIPYLYFAEVGGVELDNNRKAKAPRFPNPIVPFSYLTASKNLDVICIPIYEAHPAITEKLRGKFTPVFGKDDSLQLIRFLLDNDEREKSFDVLEEKGLSLVKILSNDRKSIDTFRDDEWDDFLGLQTGIEKVNWIKGLENKQIWKKKMSAKVNITATMVKLLKDTMALNCLSIGAKDIPICLIANGNVRLFSKILSSIYQSENIKNIANDIYNNNSPLLIVWLTGFKPRGDDSRPDRGLVPLARMLFGNDINILSIVYGPAHKNTWNRFKDDYVSLANDNGLWQAVINLSNYIIADSVTSEFGPLGNNIQSNINKISKKIILNAAKSNVEYGEHDIDTAIHLLFTKSNPQNIYEAMCNPPGGDWSGITIILTEKMTEYRWTSLPRVSESKAKRPDHVIQIDTGSKTVFLSIESKNLAKNLDDDIGVRLKNYIKLLFKNKPTAFRKNYGKWAIYNENKFTLKNYDIYTGGAFCFKNNEQMVQALEDGKLDFILAFEFKKNTEPSILHVLFGKQCKFISNVIENCCRVFGNGLEVKIH